MCSFQIMIEFTCPKINKEINPLLWRYTSLEMLFSPLNMYRSIYQFYERNISSQANI